MHNYNRCNKPLGMTDLDLLVFDKDIYTMYRNEGVGANNDAFIYDSQGARGVLANNYVVGKAESKAYLGYSNSPKIDKIDNMTMNQPEENNYNEQTNKNEMEYLNPLTQYGFIGNVDDNFIGNLGENMFFGESNLVAVSTMGKGKPVVARPLPVSTTTITTKPPILTTTKPVTIKPYMHPITGSVITPMPTPIIVAPVVPVATGVEAGTLGGGSEPIGTGGGAGGGATGGGAGGGATGGGAGGEEKKEEGTGETKSTEAGAVECKINWIPVIIGLVIGILIGYYYAKKKNKDIKTYGAIIGVVGAGLGYFYARHKCKPNPVLTKLGIPSNSTPVAPKEEKKFCGCGA